jgi:oxygen-independent coproporphyrinogen-3 oxidase
VKEAGLYIHVPFCAKKCMYCDFPSYCGKDNLMLDYSKALNLEILNRTKNKSISSVFIGGGTPTYLSLEAWENLKEGMKAFNIKENAEFTVECNPGTVNIHNLKLIKQAGANRLSIGLQAWQNELLSNIGRIHTNEEFIESYRLAREIGFRNINIDIMFGLPGQDLYMWEETLTKIIELSPEHISCYSLIIEEGTPFYQMNEKGILMVPDEDEERKMYYKALELLKKSGYGQYEISNFSKPEYQSKHNLIYWEMGDYIGCGAAAHSYIDRVRYRNEENIEKYIVKMNTISNPIVEIHENTIEDDIEEYMFMGLRKITGISETEFERRFSVKIDELYKNVILKYCKQGLLRREEGNILLTSKGVELSNLVMSDFIISK